MSNTIDAFQRRLLRRVLNVRWPDRMSNNDVYHQTNSEKWSTTIKRRRLRFIGHVLRMSGDVPVRQALHEAVTFKTKKPPGGQKQTLLATFNNDLVNSHVMLSEPLTWGYANDRDRWRGK